MRADVDVSQLKVLRSLLEAFYTELEKDIQILVVQGYGQLKELWQDAQFTKFSDQFLESVDDLYSFKNYIKEYIDEINYDIAQLEDYLNI